MAVSNYVIYTLTVNLSVCLSHSTGCSKKLCYVVDNTNNMVQFFWDTLYLLYVSIVISSKSDKMNLRQTNHNQTEL